MPPLRERVADIPPGWLSTSSIALEKGRGRVQNHRQKFLKVFQAYGWPGNVRELQTYIERAVILSDDDTLAVDETWLSGNQPKTRCGPVRSISPS